MTMTYHHYLEKHTFMSFQAEVTLSNALCMSLLLLSSRVIWLAKCPFWPQWNTSASSLGKARGMMVLGPASPSKLLMHCTYVLVYEGIHIILTFMHCAGPKKKKHPTSPPPRDASSKFDHGKQSRPPPTGPLMQLTSAEERAIKNGLLCALPILPRSLKRFVNMHRLAKSVLHNTGEGAETLKGKRIDLVYAMIVLWHCPVQLNWWIQVCAVLLSLIKICDDSLACHRHLGLGLALHKLLPASF